MWCVKENVSFLIRSDNKSLILFKNLITGYITGTPDRLWYCIRKTMFRSLAEFEHG